MSLISLNIAPDYSMEGQSNNYCPYLYLSDEQCEALGIKGSIDAGTVIGLNLRAVVTRSTTSIDNPTEGEADDKDVSLSLCITDGEIIDTPTATSKSGAAKKLYGG